MDVLPASPQPVEPVAPPPVALPTPAVVPPRRTPSWRLAVVWGVGAVLRLWFVMRVHKPTEFAYSDMAGYIDRARNFANPAFHSTAFDYFFPAGTSSILSLWIRALGQPAGLSAAAVSQALLCALEAPLLYAGARRWVSERVAVAGSVLLALHFLNMEYAGYFLSEVYLAFFATAAFALLDPKSNLKLALAGVMLGLACWQKTQAFALLPFWCLALAHGRNWRGIAAVLAGATLVLAPVSWVASSRSGRFVFVASNGGQNFALGQCPVTETAYTDSVTHTGMGFGLPVLNQRREVAMAETFWTSARYDVPFFDSPYYMREGWKCVKRFPRHALRMVFLHVFDDFAGIPGAMIRPWPGGWTPFRKSVTASNLYISLLIAPLALLGLWLGRRELGVWVSFGAPLLALMATTVVFHGDPRFRIPFDGFFFIAAAVAVERIWQRRRGQTRSGLGSPSYIEPSAGPSDQGAGGSVQT